MLSFAKIKMKGQSKRSHRFVRFSTLELDASFDVDQRVSDVATQHVVRP